MYSVKLGNGKSFTVKEDQSILDGALAAGLQLPYSCKTGRCSSCKAVISGTSMALLDETGLGPDDLKTGHSLLCARTPRSDIELDICDIEDLNLPAPQTFPAKVSSKTLVNDDIIILTLRLPPTRQFEFKPGQYINLIGPNNLRRSYSLANQDVDKELELHIKRVPGGAMSDFIFESLKVNDLLRLHGPHGTFVLRETAEKDIVFLATGTGIAPVQSMLHALEKLDKRSAPKSVTVYWGGRAVSDFYLLKSMNFNANIVPVLSRDNPTWVGRKGYVQHRFIEDFKYLDEVIVFACGSDAMISESKKMLAAKGHRPEIFFSDAFVASN